MAKYVAVVEYAANERDVVDPWAGSGYPSGAPWTYLPEYFLATIAAIRESQGIDPLGRVLSKTIGQDDIEMDSRERSRVLEEKTSILGYLMSTDYRKPDSGLFFQGYMSPYRYRDSGDIGAGDKTP